MRRVVLAISSTVVGLVILLGYKSAPGHQSGRPAALAPAVPLPTKTPSSQPAPPASSTEPPKAGRTPHSTSSGRPSKSTSRTPSARKSPVAPSGRFDGQTIDTRYGPVQVQITLAGGRLTDVSALQLPQDASHSQELSSYAAPILRQEAIRAGNAKINIVSGATYTSDGYAQSLQSALDSHHG